MTNLHIITENCNQANHQNSRQFICTQVDSLDDLSGLQKIVIESSDKLIWLTRSFSDLKQIPAEKKLLEIDELDNVAWFPHCKNSFADFVVHALGGRMASLWFELWEAGSITTPLELFGFYLVQFDDLSQAVFSLNWLPSTGVDDFVIDWTDDTIFLPSLSPKQKREKLERVNSIVNQLEDWFEETAEEYQIDSPDFFAIRAGLYQWYDALETSHEFSQAAQHEGKNRAADYWHAIMHRRESDDSNAKYWFKHVGNSPVFKPLRLFALQIAAQLDCENIPFFERLENAAWDPLAFVDFCSSCSPGSQKELLATRIQAVEMVLLMQQTMLDAQ